MPQVTSFSNFFPLYFCLRKTRMETFANPQRILYSNPGLGFLIGPLEASSAFFQLNSQKKRSLSNWYFTVTVVWKAIHFSKRSRCHLISNRSVNINTDSIPFLTSFHLLYKFLSKQPFLDSLQHLLNIGHLQYFIVGMLSVVWSRQYAWSFL